MQPEEQIKDDFLFPMSNRLSYASSPESDLDLRPDSNYDDDDEMSPAPRRKLVRSSSDPSITTADNVPGIPPYPAPPNYRREHRAVSGAVWRIVICSIVWRCVWRRVVYCYV